jgi:lycopene cyclase domain-containing protein
MKEYTILALAAAVGAVVLDRILATRILLQRRFWVALAIMFVFKIPSNGYLTGRPIVQYDPAFFSGDPPRNDPPRRFLLRLRPDHAIARPMGVSCAEGGTP